MRPVSSALALLLLVGGCKRVRQEKVIPINPAPTEAASAAHVQAPTVQVHLTSTGIFVSAPGGNIAPGCQARGPGLTVPKKNGEQDFPELRRCLVKLKAETPELAGHKAVELIADRNILYGTMIQAMDAARKTEDGGDLFPEVAFGVSPSAR